MRIFPVLFLTIATLTLGGCASQRARFAEFKEALRQEKITNGGERSIEYVNLFADKEIELRMGDDLDTVAVLKPRNPSIPIDEQSDNRYWFKQLWDDRSPVTFTAYLITTNGPVCIAYHDFAQRGGVMPNDPPEVIQYEIDEKFIAKQPKTSDWIKKIALKTEKWN